jgi:heme-degrading monooxygenase HmoA
MGAGFSIINYIRAKKPETLEKIINAFKERTGLVEGREGFRGLSILVNRERLEVLVITYWESKDAFIKWSESREFKEAHEKARRRRIEGASSEGVEYEVLEFISR